MQHDSETHQSPPPTASPLEFPNAIPLGKYDTSLRSTRERIIEVANAIGLQEEGQLGLLSIILANLDRAKLGKPTMPFSTTAWVGMVNNSDKTAQDLVFLLRELAIHDYLRLFFVCKDGSVLTFPVEPVVPM